MDEYAVKCVKVLIANVTFWVPARSEDEAIEDVKYMLAHGLENTMDRRIEPVVEPVWFNYTATKNGFLKDESTNDRK